MMFSGKKNPKGRINFPGFQEILDFTATGSESNAPVAVDGDTDKEYIILVRNTNTGDSTKAVNIYFNNDSGSNYGYQYLFNNSGTITAASGTSSTSLVYGGLGVNGMHTIRLSTASGFLKISNNQSMDHDTGTTVKYFTLSAGVYDTTSNITEIKAAAASGNFASGTNVTVYVRRSN